MVYQEQMMKAVQVVGGFSLQEADAVRKAMGKKNKALMDSYKDRFVNGAIKNGCDELEAIKIWNKIEQGASYSFNLSHAAAYGLESYVTAYLKAHYPVHFYTMSLDFANDDERPLILSEIHRDGRIKIVAPSVNTSGDSFVTDYDNNKIYWALNSIKFVGNTAVSEIIESRTEGGDFVSLEDFIERKSNKVNKRTLLNLILSGSFDEIENISSSVGRFSLIKKFYVDYLEEPIPQDMFPTEDVTKEFFWNRLQNELSGLGAIDYRFVYNQSGIKEKFKKTSYLKPEDFDSDEKAGKYFGFCGTIAEIRKMKSKKSGREFAKLTLQCNSTLHPFMIWMEEWDLVSEKIMSSKGKIIAFNGRLSFDEYSGGNQIATHKNTSEVFFR